MSKGRKPKQPPRGWWIYGGDFAAAFAAPHPGDAANRSLFYGPNLPGDAATGAGGFIHI
jgi:hypothetical protein